MYPLSVPSAPWSILCQQLTFQCSYTRLGCVGSMMPQLMLTQDMLTTSTTASDSRVFDQNSIIVTSLKNTGEMESCIMYMSLTITVPTNMLFIALGSVLC